MNQLDCGEILKGFEAARAKMFIYFASTIVEKMGKDGEGLVKQIVRDMSKSSGENLRRFFKDQGIENTWWNHRKHNGPVYDLAWEGGIVSDEPNEKIIEYTYCPLADGFKKLGQKAEMLGDLYCNETDNAFWEGYNPEWEVSREKTFLRDGFCRLVWRACK